MKLRIFPIFIALLVPFPVCAQDATPTVEQIIADIFEQYTAESELALDYESFYEDLMYCANNPINLNRASREELKRLPFLSDLQIENIQAYIYENGPLHSLYDLQLIEELDMTDIRRMLCFVRIGEGTDQTKKVYFQDFLRHGKSDVLFRFDKGLETREGYLVYNANEDSPQGYSGDNWYNSLKYRYHYNNKLLLGFTAENDPGEAFWSSSHKGYDFYSVYAQLNDIGKFKTIVLGDYRVNFGQGLVLHTDFGMGKSAYVLNVTPFYSGLKKFSSTDESNFFRGLGASYQLGKFEFTSFCSLKRLDADTLDGYVRSVLRTGYHRTYEELSQKQVLAERVAGANVEFNDSILQIGLTCVYTSYNRCVQPDNTLYNHYYFRGSTLFNAGIHYRFKLRKLNFFGETATNSFSGIATLHGCYFSPTSTLNLVLLYRYYGVAFNSFYAGSFSENSTSNNESGFYIGALFKPFKYWKFAFYADSYTFSWLKYGVSSPSIGTDLLLHSTLTCSKTLSMSWRLRYKLNEQNTSETLAVMPIISTQKKVSLRYEISYSIDNFSFRNTIDANCIRLSQSSACTYGCIAYQDLSYDFSFLPIRVDLRYLMFDAAHYENRIYSYERDVLYAFSIPSFYGKGCRYYVNLRYKVNRNLSLWFKYAATKYADDRELIGSGNDQISGNLKSDIRFLIHWSF